LHTRLFEVFQRNGMNHGSPIAKAVTIEARVFLWFNADPDEHRAIR
jgi:hypothetical protein